MTTSAKEQFIGNINRVIFDDEYNYRTAVEILTIIERHFGEWLQQTFRGVVAAKNKNHRR